MTIESKNFLPKQPKPSLSERPDKDVKKDLVFTVAKIPEDRNLESEGDDAVEAVTDLHIPYPILVIPWGENSGESYYATKNAGELKAAVQNVLKESGNERRVHLISADSLKYKSGKYPGEATLK